MSYSFDGVQGNGTQSKMYFFQENYIFRIANVKMTPSGVFRVFRTARYHIDCIGKHFLMEKIVFC